jgi:hypothetical protein
MKKNARCFHWLSKKKHFFKKNISIMPHPPGFSQASREAR